MTLWSVDHRYFWKNDWLGVGAVRACRQRGPRECARCGHGSRRQLRRGGGGAAGAGRRRRVPRSRASAATAECCLHPGGVLLGRLDDDAPAHDAVADAADLGAQDVVRAGLRGLEPAGDRAARESRPASGGTPARRSCAARPSTRAGSGRSCPPRRAARRSSGCRRRCRACRRRPGAGTSTPTAGRSRAPSSSAGGSVCLTFTHTCTAATMMTTSHTRISVCGMLIQRLRCFSLPVMYCAFTPSRARKRQISQKNIPSAARNQKPTRTVTSTMSSSTSPE